MVSIIGGKSARWHSDHCCICGGYLRKQKQRVTGTATFEDDTTIRVIYCPSCAQQAHIRQVSEQTAKEIGKCEVNA